MSRAIANRLRAAFLPPGASGRSPLGKAAARLFSPAQGTPAAAHESRSSFRRDTGRSGTIDAAALRDRGGDRPETRQVGRDELVREMREQAVGAETAEIEVEVAMDGHELADIEAGGCRSRSRFGRFETGRVVVAGDIETAQGRGQVEGGEMVGREPGDHRQQAAARI